MSATSGSLASAGKHRLREVSPPTPAPSPVPRVHAADAAGTSDAGTADSENAAEVASLRQQINALPSAARHALLAALLSDTPSLALSPLLPLIQPRLQRDFLRTLPLELALHVLSFVDEPRTLVRAAGVSKFWRGLLEDESTWRHMCWKSGFVVPDPQLANGELGGDASATPIATRNLRDLEISTRRDRDEEEERYTPAGRERRGTWDRQAMLHEFAAHTHGPGRTGLGIEQAPTDHGPGGSAADTYSLASLRHTLPPANYAATASGSDSGPSRAPASLGLDASQGLTLSLASTDPNHDSVPRPITLSPTALRGFREAFGLPAENAADEPARSPRLARLTTTQMVRDLSTTKRPRARPAPVSDARGASSSQAIPDADELLQQPVSSLDEQGDLPARTDSSSSTFSYKSHFKYAFQTEQSWVRGPGRLLSTQMSADSGVVTSLAFDGEWIIVGMETSSIHVFEGASGAYVRTLDGHQTGVWCLGLVSKGGGPRPRGQIQQARDDELPGEASETPRRTGMERAPRQPSARAETAHSAFFRPDATPLASSSYTSPGSPATTSSSQSNRPRRPRPAHRRHSSYSGTSPRAAESFASVALDADTAGGMGIGAGGPTGDSLLQGSACATARGWGQDGAVLVSGGCDRTVRVWDVSTGRCIHTLTGHASTVRCLRVLDARPVAVSGSRDGTVRIWDIDNGEPIHVLNGHASSVRAIDVSGNKAVSGSYDATCRLWNVDTGECLHVFRGHFSKIYSIAFDGARIVSGSLDSTVRVWSAQDGNLIALLQGHTTLVGQLQLDPRTNTLITGGSDGRVLVFSLKTYEMLHQLEAHSTSVNCLQFDERFIVTGGNDGRIKLWDFRTGAYIRDLCEPSLGIWRVVIRDDKVVTLSRREELAPTPEDPNRRVEKTMMDVRTFRPSPEDTTTPIEVASPGWDGYPLA